MNISFTTLIVSALFALCVQSSFAGAPSTHKRFRTPKKPVAVHTEKAPEIKSSTPKKAHKHGSQAQAKPHTH